MAAGRGLGVENSDESFVLKGSAKDLEPSRRRLTKETWVRSQTSTQEIYAAQSGTGTFFHPVLRVFLIIIIPPMLHNHIRLNNVLIYEMGGTCGAYGGGERGAQGPGGET